MARGTGTVTVKFLGDTDHLEKAFGKVNNGLGKVGHGFATMGKAAALGVGAAAAVAIPFGIKAVQMASDVEESLSKVNAVFGTSGKEIDKWAKGAATSIGLSRGEALDAAGTFGNMFVQLGIGAPKAAEMSKNIVGLAADFASFHNADISEVIAAQSAAFRGEYDSLQRFLPLINAANVEQKAMAMTGKASAKALTAQEKALAVNALMAEGAGKAVGDFARTSGGLANQMRIMKARAADFTAQVGSVLLPIVLRGLDAFGKLGGLLKDLLAPIITLVGDKARQVADVFKLWQQGGIDLAGAIAGLISEDLRFLPVIEETVNAFKGVIRIVGDVIGWIGDFIGKFQESSREVGSSASKISGIINQLKETFASAFGAIREIVRTAVDFLKGVWRLFGDDLTSFAREFWAAILEVVRGALNVLGGVFDLIKSVLTGKWGDAWNALKRIVDGVWDVIFGVVRNAVTNVIPTILAGLGQAITSAFRTAFEGLKVPFKAVLNWMIDRINDFVRFGLGPLTLANKIPGLKSVIPDIPRIPHLARGGGFSGAAIVGERGPELLVGAGRVVPNNQLGGATFNITFTGVMDKAGAAREIESLLTDFVRQGGNLRFT